MTHRAGVQNSSLVTTPPNIESGGLDLSAAQKVWVAIAASEMRLKLLRDLEPLDLGFADVEEYVIDLGLKLRSTATNSRDTERRIVRDVMGLKLRDETNYHQEMTMERTRWRRDMKDRLVENSKQYRSVQNFLRGAAYREKDRYREKYDSKVEHLKFKYKRDENRLLDEVPKGLKDYKNLSIFYEENLKQ